MCKFVFYNSFVGLFLSLVSCIIFIVEIRVSIGKQVGGKIVGYIYIYVYKKREREEGKLGYSLCFERFHRCNTRNGRKLDQMVLGKLSSLVNIVIVGTALMREREMRRENCVCQ